MTPLFKKHLKIYDNERGVFLRLALVFLVTFFTVAVFRNYVETMFLKRYGPEALPLMFVINGILTILFFKAVDKAGLQIKDHLFLAGILFFYGTAISGLFFMVKGPNQWTYPILFQLLYLLDSFIIVYLWNIANSLVNARQANRMYPVLTAVMVAGATIGSFMTEPLASMIGRDALLVLSAVLFIMLASFLILGTGRLAFDYKSSKKETLKVKPSEYPGLIKKYPILRFLIVISLIPNILLPIFFYQFSVIANNSFGSEQALLAFLSYFRGAMTASIFIILLFVSNMYSRMGLVRVSLLYPVNFVLLFFSLFFFFNIYVAAAGQVFIRLLQRAVAGPANKIFFLLVPGDISAWSQVFVRGTVVKAGMMAGSLTMMILLPFIDERLLALPAAGLAIYWAAETILFARRYKKSLKQTIIGKNIDYDAIDATEYSPVSTSAMEDYTPKTSMTGSAATDEKRVEEKMPVETAMAALNDPDPATRAQAAASFTNTNYLPATNSLVNLLDDREIVRKAALDSLSTYPEAILPELENALHRLSRRGQGSVLEVIRLAKMKNFEAAPFAGALLTRAYHNLMALRALEDVPDCTGRSLLIKHLEHENDRLLELVFRAFWVKYDDMRLIFEALKSKEAPVAVEMLECSIDSLEAGYIVPLIDILPLEEKINRGRRVLPLIKNMTLERCAGYLAHDSDPVTRMLTAFFLSEAEVSTFRITIHDLLEDPEKEVRETALYALKTKNNEEAAMPETMKNLLFLKECLIFDGLGTRELNAVASIAFRQSYTGNEVILERGVEEPPLHLIAEGRVNVLRKTNGGKIEVMKTLEPRSFFGLVKLFSGGLAEEEYIAAEPTSILIIHRSHFNEIMKLYPQIGINLCTFFALRIETLHARTGDHTIL